MKNKLIQAVAVIYFLVLIALLIFYFKTPYTTLLEMLGSAIAVGLIVGTANSFILGFLNPPQWLFDKRFFLYGLGFGLFIAAILLSNHYVNEGTIEAHDLAGNLVGGIFTGLLFYGIFFYYKFRKLEKKIYEQIQEDIRCSDMASYINSKGQKTGGLLVLTNHRLLFYSKKNHTKLYDALLNDIDPTVKKSTILNVPRGIELAHEGINLTVKFPFYWLEKINSYDNSKPQ